MATVSRVTQAEARALVRQPRRRSIPPEAPCITCGGPAALGQRAHGECQRCRSYRQAHGVPRPPHLWPGSTVPPPPGARVRRLYRAHWRLGAEPAEEATR